MKCLKCQKTYKGKQNLKLNKHLSHLSKWFVCDDCVDMSVVEAGEYAAKYRKDHKKHYDKLGKSYRDSLSESYVKRLIIDKATHLKAKDIPKEMVVAKRQFMQVKRTLNKKRDTA